jgi:hypothetical protein
MEIGMWNAVERAGRELLAMLTESKTTDDLFFAKLTNLRSALRALAPFDERDYEPSKHLTEFHAALQQHIRISRVARASCGCRQTSQGGCRSAAP